MPMTTFTCDDCSKEEQGREVAQPPAPALLLMSIYLLAAYLTVGTSFHRRLPPISRACDAQHRAEYSRVDPSGQPGCITAMDTKPASLMRVRCATSRRV